MLRRLSALKTGLLLGAGAMYLLDPERGDERRRDLADRLGPFLENTTLAPLLDALDAPGRERGDSPPVLHGEEVSSDAGRDRT